MTSTDRHAAQAFLARASLLGTGSNLGIVPALG
jgi:hypothetical protein